MLIDVGKSGRRHTRGLADRFGLLAVGEVGHGSSFALIALYASDMLRIASGEGIWLRQLMHTGCDQSEGENISGVLRKPWALQETGGASLG
jgi:hypothetical protein